MPEQQYLYESAPEAYYRQQLGIPDIGQNPYYSWLANQYAPTRAGFLGQGAMTGLRGLAGQPVESQPYQNFAQYLTGMGPTGARAQAQGILQGVRSLPYNLAQAFGETSSETNPYGVGQGGLEQLLGMALGQKIGFPMGTMAGMSASAMAPGFAQSLQGSPNQSFLSYLMSKYGL